MLIWYRFGTLAVNESSMGITSPMRKTHGVLPQVSSSCTGEADCAASGAAASRIAVTRRIVQWTPLRPRLFPALLPQDELRDFIHDFRRHVPALAILRRHALPLTRHEEVIFGRKQLECNVLLPRQPALPQVE